MQSQFDLDAPWAITREAGERFAVHAGWFTRDERAKAEAAIHAASKPKFDRVGAAGEIAVVPLTGTIFHADAAAAWWYGGTVSSQFAAAVETAAADPTVKAIVLDVNSPGGEAVGTPEAAARVAALRGTKPIVAVANGLMASAAYWIGSAADQIVTLPSATVGSIGVVTLHVDFSRRIGMMGINATVLTAGKYKAVGNPYEPLTGESRAIIEDRLAQLYAGFVGGVASQRGLDPAGAVTSWGEGRVFFGPKAVAAGLADRLGTLEQTLAELAASSRAGKGFAARGQSMTENTTGAAATSAALQEIKPRQFAAGEKLDDGASAGPVAPQLDTAKIAADAIVAERKRGQEIRALCQTAGVPDQADKLIDAGATVEEARAQLFESMCRARTLVGASTGANIAGVDNADPYAQYRADYRAELRDHARFGVTEEQYIASRCRTDGKPLPVKAAA